MFSNSEPQNLLELVTKNMELKQSSSTNSSSHTELTGGLEEHLLPELFALK